MKISTQKCLTKQSLLARNALAHFRSILVMALLAFNISGFAQATDLIISEYIEISGNNKFIEIYNGTGQTVNLSDYELIVFEDGTTNGFFKANLSNAGTLNDGEVLVCGIDEANDDYSGTIYVPLYNNNPTLPLLDAIDGNDAVALNKVGSASNVYVDIIGTIGESAVWSANNGTSSTQNSNLVRRFTVRSGVTTNPGGGFPTLASGWRSISISGLTFSNLGYHVMPDIPYNQDFEGDNDGWYAGSANQWNIDDNQGSTYFYIPPSGGTYAAINDDAVPNNSVSNDTLFSPVFDFSHYAYIQLSMKVVKPNENDVAYVIGKVNGDNSWTYIDEIPDYFGGPQQTMWNDLTINLPTAFDTVSSAQLAIVYTDNGGDYIGVAVDEIELSGTIAYNYNITITDWISQDDWCNLDGTEQITIQIRNDGLKPATGFNVSYTTNNWTDTVTETFFQTIYPGSNFTYTFDSLADLSIPDQSYFMGAFVYLIGDGDLTNDTFPTFEVISYSKPEITNLVVSDDIDCYGENGSIDMTVGGIHTPFTYSWNSGSFTTEDLDNVPALTYSVVVTDTNECTASSSIELIQPDELIATITITSDYNGYAISCNGAADGELTANVAGGTAPYSYWWKNSNEDTVSMLGFYDAAGADTYTLIVDDSKGCNATQSGAIANNPDWFYEITAQSMTILIPDTADLEIDGNPLLVGDYIGVFYDSMGTQACAGYLEYSGNADAMAAWAVDPNVPWTGFTNGSPIVWKIWRHSDGQEINVTPTYLLGTNSYEAGGYAILDALSGVSAPVPEVSITIITVNEPAAIVANSVISDANCFGESGSATISVSGGTGDFTYEWQGGETTQTLSAIAGTYSFTVTDLSSGLCQAVNSSTIGEPAVLNSTVILSDYSGYELSCNGGTDGTINFTNIVGGTSPYQTSIDNGLTWSSDVLYENLSAGSFDVKVKDANDCIYSETVVLSQPNAMVVNNIFTANYSGYGLHCFGDNDGSVQVLVAGGVPNYTYSWVNTADPMNVIGTAINITNLSAGNYAVTVTDDNGCTITASKELTQPDELTATANITSDFTGYSVSCFGSADGEAEVIVSGGVSDFEYEWTGGENTNTVTGLSAGSYQVTVTDENQCTATASVSLSQPTDFNFATTTFTQPLCNGDANGSIDLTVSGAVAPYNYNWGVNGTSQDISGISAGSYTVTVTDDNLCSDSYEVVVTEPTALSISNTYAPELECNGNTDGEASITVAGGTVPYSYLWETGSTTNGIDNMPAGVYEYTVTDHKGCILVSTAQITQPDLLVVTSSVITDENGTSVKCYGDSTAEAVAIVAGGVGSYTFTWKNSNGDVLKQTIETDDVKDTITGLPFGTFYIEVSDTNSCITAVPGGNLVLPWAVNTDSSQIQHQFNILGTSTVLVNDAPIQIGDYIGIFTDSLLQSGTDTLVCLGYTAWSGADVFINTYEKTGTTNGYAIGDTVLWKTWREGVGEIGVIEVVYDDSNPFLFNSSGTFGGNPVVNLSFITQMKAQTEAEVSISFVNVTQPDSLDADILITSDYNGFHVTCHGLADGVAEADIDGGTAPFTYEWDNGLPATESVSDLDIGVAYSLTVTDNNGCTDVATTTLNLEPDTLSFTSQLSVSNAGGYNLNCNGDNTGFVDLDMAGGTGFYFYTWSNGALNVDNITGLIAGEYFVTIVDENNCQYLDSFTLTEPTELSWSIEQDSVNCFDGNDGSIEITVNNGTPPYQYTWSVAGNTNTLDNLVAGWYYVTVTDDNACSFVDSIEVLQPDLLVINAYAGITYSGYGISCNGETDGMAVVNVQGGTPEYTYTWSKDGNPIVGSDNDTIYNIGAGLYEVTVTDASGCSVDQDAVGNVIPWVYDDRSLAPSGHTFILPTAASVEINGIMNLQIGDYVGVFFDSTLAGGEDTLICVGYTEFAGSDIIITAYIEDNTSGYEGFTNGDAIVWQIWRPYVGTFDVTNVTYNPIFNSDGLFVSGGNSGIESLTAVKELQATITNVNITEPAVLTVSIANTDYVGGFDVSCNGFSDGIATATPAGGAAPYTYSWDNLSTSSSDTALGLAINTVYTVNVLDANQCPATNSITLVDEPAALEVSDTVIVDVTCFNGDTASIDITVTGGTNNFTFEWSNTEMTEDISGLSEGTYTVDIEDENGCTISESYYIDEPDLLAVTLTTGPKYTGFDIKCNGGNDGAINLAFTGGTTTAPVFAWSGPSFNSTDQNIANLTSGSYSVTMTDDNGCIATSDTVLTEPDAIAITPTVNAISCDGYDDGSISISVVGGAGDYSYEWTVAGSTNMISGLAPAQYSVTVTDENLCSESILNMDVIEPDPLISSIDHLTYYPNGLNTDPWNVNCLATNGAVDLQVNGDPTNYVYSWTGSSNGDTTYVNSVQDPSNMGAGVYFVTVSDGAGCFDNGTITLTAPGPSNVVATVTSDYNGYDINCVGGNDGSIDLTYNGGGNAPYSIIWNFNVNSQEQNLDSLTLVPANTPAKPEYYAIVVDAGGCIGSSNFVTLNEPEDIFVQQASITDVACLGEETGSIDLEGLIEGGVAPYSVYWANGINLYGDSLGGIGAGDYYALITDANGCVNSYEFEVGEPSTAVQVSLSSIDVSCNSLADGSVSAELNNSGTAPYIYLWSDNSVLSSIENIGAGNYSVTVTDFNGCTDDATIAVNEPDVLSLVLTPTNATCFGGPDGEVTSLVGGGTLPYTYIWSNGMATENIDNLIAGTYSLTITDANSCSINETIVVGEALEIMLSATTTEANCGNADGSIDLSITNGVGPFTFNWSNALPNAEDHTNTVSAGTYSVTVTDANLCTKVLSNIVVNNFAAPVISTELSSTLELNCFGDANGAIDINSSNLNVTYNWSNFENTQDISGLSAGTYYVTVTDTATNCVTIYSEEITQPDQLVLDLVATDISCNGQIDGEIDLTVTGGTMPVASYSWSNTANTEDIDNLGADNYSVVVIDDNGCQATANADIIEPAQLSASAIISNATQCYYGTDGGIDLTVVGGTSPIAFVWSNGETTEDLANITAGNYTVTITDDNACSIIENYTVVAPDSIIITYLSSASICAGGDDGEIDIEVTGGTGGIASYLWNTGAVTQDISGLSAGTYTVTVTDVSGCTAIESFTLNAFPTPVVSISSIINVNCYGGSDGSIGVNVSGGTQPYSYDWSNGATTQDLDNLNAGVYTYNISDVNGCNVAQSITISEPAQMVVSAVVSDITCTGNTDGEIILSTIGGTGTITYDWGAGVNTSTINGLAENTYTVTVTDGNGCEVSESYTIADNTPELSAAITNVDCNGAANGAIDLTVTGGLAPFTYNWGGSNNQDLTNIAGGTYSVDVTDANGCLVTLGGLVVNEPAPLNVTLTADNGCSVGDGSIMAEVTGGTSPYVYNWANFTFTFSANTQNISGLDEGSYFLFANDANGCGPVFTGAAIGPHTQVSVDLGGPFVTCDDNLVTLDADAGRDSIQWNTGETSQTITPAVSGIYDVVVWESGCSAVDNVDLTINPTYIENIAVEICEGDSYTLGTQTLTTTGNYTEVFTLITGCDSTVNLNLTVNPVYDLVENASICDGDTYTWAGDGNDYTIAGVYHASYQTINGCDSNLTLNLSVNPIFQIDETGTICDSEVFSWRGDNYTLAGTYYDSLLTTEGCDSVYVLTLNVNPTYESTDNVAICDGDSHNWRGTDYSVAGTYYDSLTTLATGCDSVFILNLTVNPVYSYNEDHTICNGDVYNWQGVDYTTTGVYNANYQTINGCDSNYTLNLTVYDVYEFVTTHEICEGDVYVWEGNNYTTSIIDTITYLAIGGCDSTFILNLTVHPIETTTINESICDNDVYSFDGEDLNIQGTYYDTLSSVYGCDSIITLNLTVNPTYSFVEYHSICEGDVYNWHGDDYTTAGTHYANYSSMNGCDSIYTLELTVNPVYNIPVQASICEGDSYILGSQTLNTAGYYVETFTSINGCDSVVGLQLTVNPTYNDTIAETFCEGGSYEVGGQSFSTTGYHTVNLQSINGCDSIVTLNLSVTPYPVVDLGLDTTICENASITIDAGGAGLGYTYLWSTTEASQTISVDQAGVYSVDVTYNGCTTTDEIEIFIDVTPEVTIASTDITCHGLIDGTITLTPAVGAPTYAWTGPNGFTSNDGSLSNLTAGTYDVVITNSTSTCTESESVEILEPQAIAINPATSDITCNGDDDGSIELNATGGTGNLSYSWAYGDLAENLTPGTYIVDVSDANNCGPVHYEYEVIEPGLLTVVESITDVTCNGDNTGAINITISGGVEPYNILWEGSIIDEDLSGLTAGDYELVLHDANGCQFVQTYTVAEPINWTASISIVDVTINGEDNGALTVVLDNPNSGTNWFPANVDLYNYSFAVNGQTAAAQGDSIVFTDFYAGNDTVYVEQLFSGCTAVYPFVITEPDPMTMTSSVTNVNCYKGNDGAIDITPTGGVPPYTYTWKKGAIPVVGTPEDLVGIKAGQYRVTVTDFYSQPVTGQFTVTQPASAVSFTYTTTDVSCYGLADGSSINVTAGGGTPGYTYNWSDIGIDGANRTNIIAGNYTLTVSDANSCESIETITINTPDSLGVAWLQISDILCNGQTNGSIFTTAFGGTAPFSFVWNNGVYNSFITNLQGGNYELTITDNNGCIVVDDADINEPAAINISFITVDASGIGFNGSAEAVVTGGTPIYSYNWSPADLDPSTPSISEYLNAGFYDLTVTDANNCTETATVEISLVNPPPISPLADIEEIGAFGINVFPNPSKGTFTLELENTLSEGTMIQVTDGLGKTIWTYQITDTNTNLIAIDLIKFTSGVYNLQILSDEYGVINRKLMINK